MSTLWVPPGHRTKSRPPLTKAIVASMCAKAGMQPAERSKYKGVEIFVADGFSPVPWISYQRFGCERDDFPNGAFCTMWFLVKGEETLDTGLPLLFKHDHDPELTLYDKRRGRINRALVDARAFIDRRNKARLDG